MLYEFPFISLLLANVFAAPAPDTNFPTTVVQLPQAPIHAKLKRHDHLAVPASDFNQFETRANDVSPYNAVLRPTNLRTQYTTEVSFNGISRYLLVDTGSSDTWMISQDFQCMNAQHKPVPRATCNLGDPYIGSVEPIRNQCFHLAYGSGETVTGTFGHADVDVAGVTVKKQQVVVVDKAFVLGDGVRAGLLGLGPRGATSAYRGGINSSTLQPTGELLNYQPVFESMYNRTGQVEGMFSLALERGAKGGYLAFGGLPPVAVEKKFTTTPLVGVNIGGKDIRDIYHAIQPKGYTLNGKAIGTNYTVTVDSGTAVNRLPLEMAERINAAYDPPAKYDPKLQLYITACNATAPIVAFNIGGTSFQMDKRDMLLSGARIGDTCATTFTRGFAGSGFDEGIFPDGFYVLGDAFLYNVVAIFDKGKEQMHFAPHVEY